MKNSTLSIRGSKASKGTPRVDLDVFFEASQNTFDARLNPNGAFLLNMAENHHCWHLLRDRLQTISCETQIPDWVAGYTAVTGAPEVRNSIATFLETFLTQVNLDPEHLAISAGATSVIEMTAFILGNPNDVVVFPAPAYPVYKADIGNLAGLERFDLQTHVDLMELSEAKISTSMLDNLYDDLQQQGRNWSMLVLTQPDNPTGIIFSSGDLRRIAKWCIDHKVHLVVNEIYGLSLIDITHPELKEDYADLIQFDSFAKVMAELKSDFLHHWYAFSKDFGISGFRIGVLYSMNQGLLKAYSNLALGRCVSNHTQWLLQQVLDDQEFLHTYIETNQQQLTSSYLLVVRTLRKLEIPYVPAKGSLFVWADLSSLLPKRDNAEYELWMDIYQSTGILLTPGSSFGHTYPGAFRIVHSLVSPAAMAVAMKKLEDYVLTKSVG
ncbi:MAG: aminotransferase class I/II-fold pyridoxal phosphate-dependent enzyme [Saprospiraceae bacterium]|nr:aminotransferase class I/II-fold pyridoxal phosphate-dependent enzyme [Saprospiraceae bacterium]